MSIKAGSILTVAGRNVVDRLQSAGVTGQVPIETIREIGNDLVVEKVPGEPDFTFSMESLDVSTDVMAWLHGAVGTQPAASPPGAADPAGTEYRFENCQYVNVTSPWKDDTGNDGGHIGAGMILPGYYPTRIRYSFGTGANSSMTVDLAGGSYYYAQDAAPVEEIAAGDGVLTAFVTSEPAKALRIGGAAGTTFSRVWGVILDGVLQVEGEDYVQSVPGGTPAGDPAVTTITFTTAPAVGAQIKYVLLHDCRQDLPAGGQRGHDHQAGRGPWPQRPVLDRHARVDQVRLPGLQTFEFDGTISGTADREMGMADPIGRTVEGTDASGTATVRPKDRRAFFDVLSRVTGVAADEVFGYFNENTIPVEVQIQNPKNPGAILKTLYIPEGKFQPPGTPARVNTATDFPFQFDSNNGSFSEFKGARP
jgi:hypothetical protein